MLYNFPDRVYDSVMKASEFELIRLNDFVAAKESEVSANPFLVTPFGSETAGYQVSEWQMNFNRLGIFNSMGGRNLFGKSDMIIVTVPSTDTGVHPLQQYSSFGWEGKINESTAEMAIMQAFELYSGDEISEFLIKHRPVVEFSFIDSNGPGNISVRYNGRYWVITG